MVAHNVLFTTHDVFKSNSNSIDVNQILLGHVCFAAVEALVSGFQIALAGEHSSWRNTAQQQRLH